MMNTSVGTSSATFEECTRFHDVKVEIKWRIEQFDRMLKFYPTGRVLDGSKVKSPSAPHIVWHLRLSPNGEKNENADKTGIFLHSSGDDLKRSGDSKLIAAFGFHLVNEAGGKKSLTRDVKDFGTSAKAWGRFIPHDEVKGWMHADGSLLILVEVEFLYPMRSNAEEAGPLPSSLNNSLAELLDEGTNSDCTIVVGQINEGLIIKGRHGGRLIQVGTNEIRAHRGILSTRSATFKAMFSNGAYSEAAEGRVTIKDFSYQAVKAMLDFFYSATVPLGLSHPHAEELFKVADKYQAITLRNEMARRLTQQISAGNFFTMLALADTHSSAVIKKACAKYIFTNHALITQKAEWQQLKQDHGKLTTELMEMAHGWDSGHSSSPSGGVGSGADSESPAGKRRKH